MGVRKTTYLIFGIKLNQEQGEIARKHGFDEKHNFIKYIEGRKECEGWSLIYDGMCDKDHYFGKIFAESNEWDEGEKNCQELDSDEITGYLDSEGGPDLFLESFLDCFEGFVPDFDSENEWKYNPKLMLVSHYD